MRELNPLLHSELHLAVMSILMSIAAFEEYVDALKQYIMPRRP